MKFGNKQIYPLLVVLLSISIIEVAMTAIYPKLSFLWEKIPVLIVIVLIPIAVIAAFIYLWLKRPGHLYPPSEFGTGNSAKLKLDAFQCRVTGKSIIECEHCRREPSKIAEKM